VIPKSRHYTETIEHLGKLSHVLWLHIRALLCMCTKHLSLKTKYAPYSDTWYRVHTNYWMFSLDYILSWKCAMILKFMPNTTQRMYIWNGLNITKTISWERLTSLFYKQSSWYVLESVRSNSTVVVQWAFWLQFGHCGPPALSIQRWYDQFHDRGCICHQGKGHVGRPSVTEVAWLDHWTSVFVSAAICMGITATISLEFLSL
jgi:hypothetical protein